MISMNFIDDFILFEQHCQFEHMYNNWCFISISYFGAGIVLKCVVAVLLCFSMNFSLFVDMTLMVLRENVDKMCDEINAKKMNKTTTTISKTVMVLATATTTKTTTTKNKIRPARNSWKIIIEKKTRPWRKSAS